jgi:hypothetical protein
VRAGGALCPFIGAEGAPERGGRGGNGEGRCEGAREIGKKER